MRRLSPTRVAGAAALSLWAGVFWFLIVSGRWTLYLSGRIFWVVPTGAVILTAAAIGRLLTMRTERSEPLPRREAWGLALIMIPAVAVLVLPPAALGAFAADRRPLSAGFVTGGELSDDEVSLVDVAGSMWSERTARALAEKAGHRVEFIGIVVRRDTMPADEFMLTRFIVSCCVADALSVQVRVVGAPPGQFQEDQWVQVTGTIYPLGQEIVVDAARVEKVPRPDEPYLNV